MSSTSGSEADPDPASSASAPSERFGSDLSEATYQSIFETLRIHGRADFSGYKRGTIRRRIKRRMQVLQVPTGAQYANYLKAHPSEAETLFRTLLIQVTQFFREPPAFEVLVEVALRRWIAQRSPDQPLRVWVPGCATGEEAYSVAILFAELAAQAQQAPPLQMFATDMDMQAIAFARRGVYPASIEEEVSPERLKRFFLQEKEGYRIRPSLREQIIFAPQNVAEDPPFSRLDLISCRNVLIYLDTPLQKQVLQVFHYALKTDGYLFLGSSESIGEAEPLFAPQHKTVRLFQRRSVERTPPITYPLVPYKDPLFAPPPHPQPSASVPVESNYRDTLHQRLLEHYAPPSLLVNASGTILQLSGATQPFLVFPEGELSTNILDLVREDLRLELRLALHRAEQSQALVRLETPALAPEASAQALPIIVDPLPQPSGQTLFRISFEDRERAQTVAPSQTLNPPADARDLIRRLEEELADTKQRLHDAIEEKEQSKADLYATIEELRSMNEELQSTTEELQTSKEELQSLNEELQTVNEQLHHNIEELTHTNNDLQNLITSTDIATIFLDQDFRIMRYTERATDLFRLIESDLGRPLSDVRSTLIDLDVTPLAQQVYTSLAPGLQEVHTVTQQTYLMRVLPYRTQDHHITGVVFTFIDITQRKRFEEALVAAKEEAEAMNRIKTAFLANMSHEIRTPLTSVIGFADLLLNTLQDESRELATFIVRGGTRLLETLNAMLDLARLEAGEIKLGATAVDVVAELREAVDLLRPVADERNLTINFVTSEVTIDAILDRQSLHRIATNLLINAIKFTETGDITLTLESDENRIIFSVEDAGAGINPHFLPRVFEAFQQESTGTARSHEGIGLGLTICKRLVDLMQGTITVVSQKHKGSTFTVTLPKQPAAQ